MAVIQIVGLGAGQFEQLPIGVYQILQTAKNLYIRTKEHPVVARLEDEGITFESFDHVYENEQTFLDTYEAIVSRLLTEVKRGDLVYAVPGHPLVAEKTVQLLLEEADKAGVEVRIEGGHSFLDALFSAVQIDPIEGCQIVDATSLQASELQLRHHIIVTQVYDRFVASEVKLTLMERLPDDYEIKLVEAAGSEDETVQTVPLYELDRIVTLSQLLAIYVPPVRDEALLYHDFNQLRQVIATLRSPDGCPWDQAQTHQSLKPYLLEEAYEVFDAIDDQDSERLEEELGDVLLQVLLHAQISEEEGYFTISDVVATLTEKMIRRHPHVFGNEGLVDRFEVEQNWAKIKASERVNDESVSLLQGVSNHLPALAQAHTFQKKANQGGFDWTTVQHVWEKLHEELKEFRAATTSEERTEELGDLLFTIVNLARFYQIDAESALRSANKKFKRRFTYIEQSLASQRKNIQDVSIDNMNQLWEEAKRKECK